MKAKRRRRLVCPNCGWDTSKPGAHWHCLRYLEEVTHEREVHGFDEHGVLIVDVEERISIEDGGANHRLLCGNCLEEFPLPDGEVDFRWSAARPDRKTL